MVTAEGDDTRECLALDRGTTLVGVCGRVSRKKVVVSLFNLAQGPGIVVRGHGDVTAVQHSGPTVEWVRLEGDIVAATSSALVPFVIMNVHCYVLTRD